MRFESLKAVYKFPIIFSSATRSIEFFLKKWGLTAEEVAVNSFLQKDIVQDYDCPGIDSVHMFIITLQRNGQNCGSVT